MKTKKQRVISSVVLFGCCVGLASCIRLMGSPDREFGCKDDSDCLADHKCLKKNSYSTWAYCRAADWCDEQSDCKEGTEYCHLKKNKCLPQKEEQAACQEDYECGEMICYENQCRPGKKEFEECTSDEQCAQELVCHKDQCRRSGGMTGFCEEKHECASNYTCQNGDCTCKESTEEKCNGIDDDCNTKIDDGFKIGEACEGVGECGPGVMKCKGKSESVCSTGPGGSEYEGVEERCDGLDNDCDGEVDESFTVLQAKVGEPCEYPGVCGVGTVECSSADKAVCSTAPGSPKSPATTEVCDGKDNDCDGEVDALVTSVNDELQYDECGEKYWAICSRRSFGVPSHAKTLCEEWDAHGYQDWRVPTDTEIYALLNCKDDECEPCSSVDLCRNLLLKFYWSTYEYISFEVSSSANTFRWAKLTGFYGPYVGDGYRDADSISALCVRP